MGRWCSLRQSALAHTPLPTRIALFKLLQTNCRQSCSAPSSSCCKVRVQSCSQFSKYSRAGLWVWMVVSACWDFILHLTCAKETPGPTQWGEPWGRTDLYFCYSNCLVLKDAVKNALIFRRASISEGGCMISMIYDLAYTSFQCPGWSHNKILFV